MLRRGLAAAGSTLPATAAVSQTDHILAGFGGWQRGGRPGEPGLPRGLAHPSRAPQAGAEAQPSLASTLEDAGSITNGLAARRKPPRVLSVGGSIAGCCAALALGRVGCQVDVFERSSHELESQGAGLVLQPDLRDFVTYFGIMLEDVCVTSQGRQYVDGGGAVLGVDDTPQLFTGWDTLYRALKSKVEGERYHLGSTVTSLDVLPAEPGGRGGVAVTLGDGRRFGGDLMVGADGGGSLVRARFWPQVASSYVGYVAWRGCVAEAECPPALLHFLGEKFTLFQGPHHHMLAFVIPGAAGETAPGRRRVNWVWYCNVGEGELRDCLRDEGGVQHGHSVPRGRLRAEVSAERQEAARKLLPPALADLVCGTPDIFMQAIHDLITPSMTHQGRVALVGDSACVLRPHTAAGTTKAAVNAWSLSKSLQSHGFNLEAALAEYNLTQMELAGYLRDVGISIGTRTQFGEPPGGGRGGGAAGASGRLGASAH